MPAEYPIFLRTRLGRRRALRVAAGTAVLLSGATCDHPVARPPEEPSPIEQIRLFEQQVGDRVLTDEELDVFLPMVARLFTTSLPTSLRVPNITRNTFLVRRDFNTPREEQNAYMQAFLGNLPVDNNPTIQRLRSDYPNEFFSDSDARGTLFAMTQGALAWATDTRVMLVSERVNSNKEVLQRDFPDGSTQDIPTWQYEDFGYSLFCSKPSAAARVRSIYLHELTHYSSDRGQRPISDRFLATYQDAVNTLERRNNKVVFKNGKKRGFAIIMEYEGKEVTSLQNVELNELVTEYIATKINIMHNLPYTHGYHGKHMPAEFANFESVLNSANISFKELVDMYQGSKLEEFLIKLATGAQNIQFANETEKLRFGIEHFLYFNMTNGKIPWNKVVKYYPGVNTTKYEYVDSSKFRKDPGIHWDDPELNIPPNELGCLSK